MEPIHPLDRQPADDTPAHVDSDWLSNPERATVQAIRRLSLWVIAISTLVIVVSGITSVHARAASDVERVASAINRFTSLGILVGLIGLLLSFRPGILPALPIRSKGSQPPDWLPSPGWDRPSDINPTEQTLASGHPADTLKARRPSPSDHLVRPQSPLSLALLFYLIALAAVVSACLQLLRGIEVPPSTFLAFCSAGAALGFFVGSSGGAFVTRCGTAVLIGGMLGLPLGGIAGLLAMIEQQRFDTAMLSVFASCGLLILGSLLGARFNKPARIS
jgi:hypothetical protein